MREEEERIPLASGSSSLLESEEEELEMTAVTLVWAGSSIEGLGGSSTEGCSLGFGGSSSELESDSRPSDEKSNQYGR